MVHGETCPRGYAAEADVVDDAREIVFDAYVRIADEGLRQNLEEVDSIGAGLGGAGAGVHGVTAPLGHHFLCVGPAAVIHVEGADVGEQVLGAKAEEPLRRLRLDPHHADEEQDGEEELAEAF